MSDNARMQLNHIAQKLDAPYPKWVDLRTCRRPGGGGGGGRDRFGGDRRRGRSRDRGRRGRSRSRSRDKPQQREFWEVEGSFTVNGKTYKAIGRAEWRMDERRSRNAAKEEAAIELLKMLTEANLDNPQKEQIEEAGEYTMEELREACIDAVKRGSKSLPRGERASYVSAADLARGPDGILLSLLSKQVRKQYPGFTPENCGYRRFGDFVKSCPYVKIEMNWCTYDADKTKGDPGVYQICRSKYRSENEEEEAKNQQRTTMGAPRGSMGRRGGWRPRGGRGWGPMGYGWRGMRGRGGRFPPRGRGMPGRGFGPMRGPPRGFRGGMRAPPPSTIASATPKGPPTPGPGPEIGPVTSSW